MKLGIELWVKQLVDKTADQQAAQIMGNLIGYRASSQYRSDDEANLASAINAIVALAVDKAKRLETPEPPPCFDTCFAILDKKEMDILRVDDLQMLFSNSGSRDEHMARFASTRYEGIEVDVITALERDSEKF